MRHFVIVYDRRSGDVHMTRHGMSAEALRQTLALRRVHSGRPDTEVILLHSPSEQQLRRTHARYFGDIATVLRQAEGGIAKRDRKVKPRRRLAGV